MAHSEEEKTIALQAPNELPFAQAIIDSIFKNQEITKIIGDIFLSHIATYRQLLEKEEKYLPEHVNRVKEALKALSEAKDDDAAFTAISKFCAAATNSNFNPRLKRLGIGLALTLLGGLMGCSFGFLVVAAPPAYPFLWMVASGVFTGSFMGAFAAMKYAIPVTKSLAKGREISRSLTNTNFFQKKKQKVKAAKQNNTTSALRR
ncbi:MAG: hypothetical protein K0R24_1713 [Gammaproteobacteria bacterium]|jgi:hypothetical protein|nr:hypothetical protein [Gammaproteobacteria bacterium]